MFLPLLRPIRIIVTSLLAEILLRTGHSSCSCPSSTRVPSVGILGIVIVDKEVPVLVVASGLLARDPDHVECAPESVTLLEDLVHLLQRSVRRLWVEEIYARDHEGVDDGEYDVCLVSNVCERWRCDHYNQELRSKECQHMFFLQTRPDKGSRLTLKIQLAVVEIALAGARIDSGVTSAGYSHVMPSQPTAKKELKTNKKTAAAMPALLLTSENLLVAASTTIEPDMPTAPKSINLRRPNFSIVKMAIQEAMKYSVPFNAASRRLIKFDSPMRTNSVAA